MPAASAAPAAGAGAAAAPVEEVAAPKEKTVFNVNLTKIDAAQKAKAIREVKALMPSMNLVEVSLRAPERMGRAEKMQEDVRRGLRRCRETEADDFEPFTMLLQAKKFVESLPKVLKENATKEESEKLQALFKGIGAEVTLD
jgi:large subunit ribosomal protein L7/L12